MLNNKSYIGEESEIKYCVCAMIDLLGFSSHLEISSYDLRTSIGEQAVTRLENLELILQLIQDEKSKRPECYPLELNFQRINDAIFFSLDIDDILKPSVGSSVFHGISKAGEDEIFSKVDLNGIESFKKNYDSRIEIAIKPLIQFLGFISRIHVTLNKMESKDYFPGAKTVVSTGFRRQFKGDHFSANFALANSFQAENSLHGPSFYVDNAILHIISYNCYVRNLLRFAHFQFKKIAFDCFEENEEVYNSSSFEATFSKIYDIKLFRKNYQFRELNPSPITYLQNIDFLNPYLRNEKKPFLNNIYFKHIFNAIKIGFKRKDNQILKPPKSFLFNSFNDLSNDIGIINEFISTGKSITREKLKIEEFEKKYEDVNEEGKKKIKEFLEKETDIEFEEIDLDEIKTALYEFNDEVVNGLIPLIKGDIEQLDFNPEVY